MLIRLIMPATAGEARARLAELVEQRGETFASLSRMLARPAGYLLDYARSVGEREMCASCDNVRL